MGSCSVASYNLFGFSIVISVVYYENGSNENILQFVIDNRGSKNTTFVIDECTETLHAKLARQALSDDSNINLITICNEPDYARANAPQAIVLAPDNFKDVVSDLLKDAYKDKLSNLTFPIYTVKKHD